LTPYTNSVDYFVLGTSHSDAGIVKLNCALSSKTKELKVPFFISDSISTENIKDLLEEFIPHGFDADSFIERSPKRKDYDKMSSFIKGVHGLKI
jgi:phosphoribosylanthranilate isomerase